MTHYDHATAMAYKLDRWSETRAPRNYELEIQAHENRAPLLAMKKPPVPRRCLGFFKSSLVKGVLGTLGWRK